LFSGASDVAVTADGSTIYIADTGNHCIRTSDALLDGSASSTSSLVPTSVLAGKCGSASTDGAFFDQPQGLALDQQHHRLWVLDNTKKLHGVVVLDGEGGDDWQHDDDGPAPDKPEHAVYEFDPGFDVVATAVAVSKVRSARACV
jgi:DNA-binding beta-propeller fold protein YncE